MEVSSCKFLAIYFEGPLQFRFHFNGHWMYQIWKRMGFPQMGVPLVIIHVNRIFPNKNHPAIGEPPWRAGNPHMSRETCCGIILLLGWRLNRIDASRVGSPGHWWDKNRLTDGNTEYLYRFQLVHHGLSIRSISGSMFNLLGFYSISVFFQDFVRYIIWYVAISILFRITHPYMGSSWNWRTKSSFSRWDFHGCSMIFHYRQAIWGYPHSWITINNS